MFLALMGGDCANCNSYRPHFNAALTAAQMSCPDSIAAFAALARHDTNALSVMSTGTTAGAVHMPPPQWREACRAITVLSDSFKVSFPSCGTVDSDPCACGSDTAGAAIVGRPEFAFRVAAEWFMTVAASAEGAPCGDLREDAEVGAGTRGVLMRGVRACHRQ